MILVNSFGGCGSKYLAKQIYKNVSGLNYHNLHRHVRDPNILNNTGIDKVVMVVGSPSASIKSFFWRQKSNTTQHGFNERDGKGEQEWPYKHCMNLGGEHQEFSKEWDLSCYLSNKKDLFMLEDFYSRWVVLESQLDFDVMVIKYESLYRSANIIFDFLESELKVPFDAFLERTSNSQMIDESDELSLFNMYVELENKIKSQPDVLINYRS